MFHQAPLVLDFFHLSLHLAPKPILISIEASSSGFRSSVSHDTLSQRSPQHGQPRRKMLVGENIRREPVSIPWLGSELRCLQVSNKLKSGLIVLHHHSYGLLSVSTSGPKKPRDFYRTSLAAWLARTQVDKPTRTRLIPLLSIWASISPTATSGCLLSRHLVSVQRSLGLIDCGYHSLAWTALNIVEPDPTQTTTHQRRAKSISLTLASA